MNYFAVSFGELDISPITVAVMIGISAFTFLAVGLSSLNLVKSLFKDSN